MNFTGIITGCLLAAAMPQESLPPRASSALRHDVYIWQRQWSESVEAAVLARGTNFSELIPLVAEVRWEKGRPVIVRPSIPFPTLALTDRPVGLALRIGPFSGPFASDDERAHRLAELAASMVAEARTNLPTLAELQIDFDCAESKLDGYRLWVEAIRRRVAPGPVVFTALPSWLKRPEFATLARAADGFVLQVHSLDPPRRADAPFTLCDPAAARRAVTQAARVGLPFRVALPTYGYLVAFNRDGKFLGLSAEGPASTWPQDGTVREVRADPAALAGLVAEWTTHRPAMLQGVIWYRLPVPGDRLNWRWPTLAAVMTGTAPQPSLRAVARRTKEGLVEIDLHNDGESDASRAMQVTLRWSTARVVACDGLGGFSVTERAGNDLRFHVPELRLEAGRKQPVGWVRFDRETEVEAEVEPR